jgi:hypothetical protein
MATSIIGIEAAFPSSGSLDDGFTAGVRMEEGALIVTAVAFSVLEGRFGEAKARQPGIHLP